MTTIADLTIPASEFVLSWTLQEHPEAVVAVERVVAVSESAVTPYFWVSDGDADEFDALLADDPTVERFDVLEADEAERFYRARWTEKVRPLTYVLRDAEGTILHAIAKEGTWRVRALFPDDEDLSRFHDFCATYDLSFDLDRIFSEHEGPVVSRYLTDPQRHILAVAHEMGYFEVPRDAALSEVADHLGISTQAASKRLRRAQATLVEEVFEVGGLQTGAPIKTG